MDAFFNVITLSDVLFAIFAAFALTHLITKLKGRYIFIGAYSNIKVGYDASNSDAIVKNCAELFPREMIIFNGDTFKRGNVVQILTAEKSKITGKLIGADNDNMICVIDAKYIIAHELSRVLSITLLDAGGEED